MSLRLVAGDIYTKFLNDWFRHSKVNRGGYIDTQQGDLINLLLFFKIKEFRLKTTKGLSQNFLCGVFLVF
jgi:hypothetical protein